MKRLILTFVCICLFLLLASSCGTTEIPNQEEPSKNGTEGVSYAISSDGTYAYVTGYDGEDAVIEIAGEYNGLPVKEIGEKAFAECRALTKVTIPPSVKRIGDRAFWQCTSLKEINLPDGVEHIGESAFSCCYDLKSIRIPSALTSLSDSVFYSCESLSEIVIPNSIKTIGESAFSYCEGIETITIPDSVVSVGERAFSKCTSLKSVSLGKGLDELSDGIFYECTSLETVEIPDGIIRIGESAFRFCRGLTSINLGKGVSELGDGAFAYCESLKSFSVDAENEDLASLNGDLYNSVLTTLINYAPAKEDKVFTVPSDVVTIKSEAFLAANNLEKVIIHENVSFIENSAFDSCESLRDISVNENNGSYFSIDGNLYDSYYNTLLTYAMGKSDESFVLPEEVTGIDPWAVRAVPALKKVYIHDGVTTMSTYAFGFCSGLTIYCEAHTQPDDWCDYWYDEECNVVWGYKG